MKNFDPGDGHPSPARSPPGRASRARSELLRDIVQAGLITGALDAAVAVVLYVFVLHALSVLGVLQFIASGLLGTAAFQGGLVTALLGFAIHFFLALAFAALFIASSQRLAILGEHPVASGILYGAAIYFLMNFVVLPFTAVPRSPVRAVELVPMLLDHMFFVGLPTALIVAHRGQAARAPSPA
ncbi:hypothetical protein [Anaeromyxobacter oryzae]|uniref:Integral membrane protein n=1 Tax=Anaeromyxobacter oryzae TaxID=2918170 RepID=A0ABM7WPU8_9BACT|nr:hypothetical protein [Anaeromyxobacter oryzae]BDG01492.1 hypothetical protein AMOR_04880 [Anaeromyxobacter oryzae]